VQGQTLAASVGLAAALLVAGGATGHLSLVAPVCLGLVLGSLNGFVIQQLLDRRAPILPTAVLRLAMFSILALAAARLTGWSLWPMVLGIGLAQLVMVGVGTRQGIRA
jgi:hypothetical protein